jgi:hypothetical protein
MMITHVNSNNVVMINKIQRLRYPIQKTDVTKTVTVIVTVIGDNVTWYGVKINTTDIKTSLISLFNENISASYTLRCSDTIL